MAGMLLQINRNSFTGKYDVLDDRGTRILRVQEQLKLFGRALDLQDMTGRTLATIKIEHRFLSFVAEYHIEENGISTFAVN